MGYLLQDLQCLKCKDVKMMNLSKLCNCAGKFKTLTDPNDMSKILKTFKSIAIHYQMETLKEITEFNLLKNPHLKQ